jgi:hypothetical protein
VTLKAALIVPPAVTVPLVTDSKIVPKAKCMRKATLGVKPLPVTETDVPTTPLVDDKDTVWAMAGTASAINRISDMIIDASDIDTILRYFIVYPLR